MRGRRTRQSSGASALFHLNNPVTPIPGSRHHFAPHLPVCCEPHCRGDMAGSMVSFGIETLSFFHDARWRRVQRLKLEGNPPNIGGCRIGQTCVRRACVSTVQPSLAISILTGWRSRSQSASEAQFHSFHQRFRSPSVLIYLSFHSLTQGSKPAGFPYIKNCRSEQRRRSCNLKRTSLA